MTIANMIGGFQEYYGLDQQPFSLAPNTEFYVELSSQQECFNVLNYALETKSSLLKTANWLAQGLILKKIQAYTSYSIKPELEMAKKQMESYLKNYSPTKGLFINGSVKPILIKNIQLTDQALVATINTTGKLDLKINGLQ